MESDKPLGYFLAKGHRIFKIQMVSRLKEQGIELTFDQFVILQILNSNSNIIQQDLANYMQKDKSIIVRQVEGLLEKQLVTKVTNKEDNRKKNLILTRQGTTALNQMQQVGSEVTKKLLSGISETDLEIFRNVLNRIQENGEADVKLISC